MRVLHLMRSSENIFGAERVLLAELTALRAHEVDARFLIIQETRQGTAGDMMAQAAQELSVPVIRLPVSGQFSIDMIKRLKDVIVEQSPQIIHTHGYKADVLGLAAARLAHIPVVGEISGWLFLKQRPLIRFYEWMDVQALKQMDRTIVLADYYRRLIRHMGFRAERIRVIPSGIDQAKLCLQAGKIIFRQSLNVPDYTPTVGMLTRLSFEKGVDVFLRCMRYVLRLYPSAQGIIFGNGPELPKLTEAAQQMGIEKNIIWAGYVQESVDALLALDVVVQSSRIEALPQTLMEAMALGKPVVTTEVGGCPELVVDQETGFVVPTFDEEALASRICYLFAHPDLARKFGQAGAKRIEEKYSMQQWAKQMIRVYQGMV